MSMSRVFGIGVVGLAVGYGYIASKQERQDVVARFQLNKKQVVAMNSCISSMRDYKVKFRKGAGRVEGCGCMAKQMTDRLSESQYTEAFAILDAMFSGGSKGNYVKIAKNMSRAQKKYKIAQGDARNYMRLASLSIRFCGEQSNHRKAKATS